MSKIKTRLVVYDNFLFRNFKYTFIRTRSKLTSQPRMMITQQRPKLGRLKTQHPTIYT